MGQIEENNAFLLGMVSKGVVRVREVVKKGGGGGVMAYEAVEEVAEYVSAKQLLTAWQDVEEIASYDFVGAMLAGYEALE